MVRLIERYLIEDIEAVRKQYSYIPEDEFDRIIRIDPTFREDRDSVGKYGKWLLGLYKKHPESYDNNNLPNLLSKYDELKNDRRYNIEKDIMRLKSVEDLENAISNAGETELTSRQQSRQDKKNKDYDMVFEGDTYAVFVPRNHAGNMALASFGGSSKAKWCTAADSETGIEMYDKYLKHGGKYYVLINKNDYNEKYQFHFESDQFLNQNNHRGDHFLLPVLLKDKKLVDFFSKEGYSNNAVVNLVKSQIKVLKSLQKIQKEYIKEATLLSFEEYKKYKNNIKNIHTYWWLRSFDDYTDFVCCVNDIGNAEDAGEVIDVEYDTRPALVLNLRSSNLVVGDRFQFGEHIFTIVSNNLAICNDSIGKECFRKDWEAEDSNIYGKSDVKKFVDEWFNKTYAEYNDEANVNESYRRIKMKEY